MARRIVAHFGLETLDIIEGKADRLIETPGIGRFIQSRGISLSTQQQQA
jgi:hypothetical protein